MKYFWPWSKTQSHYRRCFTAAGPFAYTLYLFSCFSGATQQRALLFSWHSALSGWTYNYALEIVNPQGVKILLQIETCFMLVQKDLFLCYFLFLCLPLSWSVFTQAPKPDQAVSGEPKCEWFSTAPWFRQTLSHKNKQEDEFLPVSLFEQPYSSGSCPKIVKSYFHWSVYLQV